MQSWKGKIVSRAGKEILLKFVIQEIPSYVTGVFLLPQKLCDELEVPINRFWWVSNVENKANRWMRWDRMWYPKKLGGMGFRRVRDFNVAMLVKQVWRVMIDHQSWVTWLLKARYYPSVPFREAMLGNNPTTIVAFLRHVSWFSQEVGSRWAQENQLTSGTIHGSQMKEMLWPLPRWFQSNNILQLRICCN